MRKKYFSLGLMLLMSLSIWSQETQKGIIEGRVFDAQNNEGIPFAVIIINGTNISSVSDLDGNYLFTGVKPGYIELKATSIGYDPFIATQVMVTNAKKAYIEMPMQPQTVALEAVVVKASPFRKVDESPVSLRSIGIKEIEKSPGGNRDISKVIQSYPGVGGTSFRNDVIVRGGGSSENRFYLDGVEIPNLNHFATQGASGGPVGIINVDFVREVKFYSGAFPANRGNALSSVLEFQQIDGNKDRLKTRTSIGASDMALTFDGPLTKNTTFIASARRSYLQFLFSALKLPFLPTYNDFQFKTRTKIDDKNEILVIGLGAIDVNRLNLKANETENQRYILGYLPVNEQWNYTLGTVYRHYRENGSDQWVLSRNMLNNVQYKYPNNDESKKRIFDYSSFEAENKLRFERTINAANGMKWTLGANTEYARYYNQTYRLLPLGAVDYRANLDLFKFGAFAQASQKFINKKLTLSAGIRIDANTYSASMQNPLNQLSPRFSASYAIAERWNWNFNTGRYFQQPSYTTLGYKNSAGQYVNKNNGLEYVQANHIVTGFDFLPNDQSKFSVEGFLKMYSKYPFSVKDSIAIASKGADFGTFGDEEVKSIGEGRSYGVEFLYQTQNLLGTYITLSYTLVRSEFKNNKGNYIASSWDNRHLFNILLRREFKGNWDVGAKWRLVGGSPYTPADLIYSASPAAWNSRNQAYLDYSRFNSLRLGSFNQLDIRIDKEYFFDKWSLITYMDVQNVLNFKSDIPPTYIRDTNPNGLPKLDTNGNYVLKALKSDGGGTILPTIGVIVEF
jgi:hypothetical protein